ncbi:hypothetical protein C8T65DRAFT_103277 [Cerioporus squamosus]|nr:hypothetical protein C8T65DRAFT_103277 [Cerioporus squamosus]
MRRGVERCEDSGEASLIWDMATTYAECLERAIQGREEHHRRFFVEADTAHQEYLDILRKKRQDALAFLEKVENRKQMLLSQERKRQEQAEKRPWQELARLLMRLEQEKEESRRIEHDTGRETGPIPKSATVMARCAARLAYEEQTRCTLPVTAHQKFCHAHCEEHRAAVSKLEQVKRAAEAARSQTYAMLGGFESSRASKLDDVKAELRHWLSALEEELQLVETHQQRFQCKTTVQHASDTTKLKSDRDEAQELLDCTTIDEEPEDSASLSGVSLWLAARADSVDVYLRSTPWGRAVLRGAMAALGERARRRLGDRSVWWANAASSTT